MYPVNRRLHARISTDLAMPIPCASFMFLFATIRYSDEWFTAPKGNIFEQAIFTVSCPLSKEVCKTKSNSTNFEIQLELSPSTWIKIYDGLSIKDTDLVLDFNPSLDIFPISHFLFFSFCFPS